MSEFKFACPVCGQHITCDSASSGKQMECPTCYRKLVVPQAPAPGSPGLTLTAAQVGAARPLPQAVVNGNAPAAAPEKKFPVAMTAIAVVVVCAAAGGAVLFRDKIFKSATTVEPPVEPTNEVVVAPSSPAPPASDTNWSLSLAEVALPDSTAVGRVNGRDFIVQRATIRAGTLDLRQGPKWPPDLGFTVNLFAKQAEDLAGQTIEIKSDREASPRIVLRWKDDQQQPVTRNVTGGYAMKLVFGSVAGNRLAGKIYLCTPDDTKSYVAGNFNAEIRKPSPPRPAQPKAAQPAQPK